MYSLRTRDRLLIALFEQRNDARIIFKYSLHVQNYTRSRAECSESNLFAADANMQIQQADLMPSNKYKSIREVSNRFHNIDHQIVFYKNENCLEVRAYSK